MNLLKVELEVVWLDERSDTMTKVRNPSLLATTESSDHLLHDLCDGLPAAVQNARVRITLQNLALCLRNLVCLRGRM